MKLSLRKRMIAGAIATLLAAPAWSTSVTADDPAKARTGAQSGSEMKSDTERSSATGNTERSSGTGTSQSGTATGTTSGSAGTGTTGSAGAGATGSAGTGTTGSAGAGATGSAGTGATGSAGAGTGTAASGAGSTSPSMGAGTTRLDTNNPLYSRTVDELEGTDVVDASGNEIGEIEKVVLTQDRRSAHAVVSVGGFLGIGERDIVVSLDEFRPAGDDKLQLNATKDELKARPKYESEQYVELEGDQLISGSITDFAAFETDRNRTTGTPRDSDAKTMDKAMDKDKEMRQPSSTGSGAAGTSGRAPADGATGSGATGSGTTGSGTTR